MNQMILLGKYDNGKLTAYLYDKQIVICTKYQAFRVISTSPYAKDTQDSLNRLYNDIRKGKTKKISDIDMLNGRLTWKTCSQPRM